MAYIESEQWDPASVRKRAIAIGIVLALEALFILAILSLGMRTGTPGSVERGLMTFSVEAQSAAARKSDSKAETAATKMPERNLARVIPKPLLPPVNPVQAPPPSPNYIKVSKADFDAMDLSKIPSENDGGTGDAAGAGQDSKAVYGPGQGPGGAQLYPVAWYREPYDAELRPYLAKAKSVPPGASAEIACIMIENYHVENCRTLSESPRGTGLASALRQAAWQFLVRPPRIGSKPQLGVWVRIRFDFGKAEGDEVP